MKQNRSVNRSSLHFAFVALGLLCFWIQSSAAAGRSPQKHLLGPDVGRGGPRGISVVASSNPQVLLDCLLGPGVSATNVVLNAAPGAAGTFSGGLDILGIGSGVVLSSGNVDSLPGPNKYDDVTTDNGYPGDPDLDGLIPGYQTFDATILEFDFDCPNPQVVSFQYVFASDEYNEWVNSPYNDVFGFFLNGTNIATVPSGCSSPGVPVSINNVNCDNPYAPPGGSNCNCYRNNDLSDGGPFFDTEMDGLVQVFYATGTIQAGTNHIKLAVADAGDPVLDSNVMLACQSFNCAAAPPTGACCFPNGTCVTLSYLPCYNQGGNYYGDNIPCVPNPCGDPVGACCFPEGECEVEGEFGCTSNGGTYLGNGVSCNPNPCSSSSVQSQLLALGWNALSPAPNPSAGRVTIRYRLARPSSVLLEIFDASGTLVRRISSGPQAAGAHEVVWDGRYDSGRLAPAGIFLLRTKSADGIRFGRLTMMR